jgi:hypothetical protein
MPVVDRFVRAAPLIVGVKCSDGVLLLAAHTFDDDEPLLYYYQSGSDDDASDGGNGTDLRSSSTTTTESPLSAAKSPAHGSFRDLPLHYAGPFRIQVIDPSSCLTIASTGWRADCDDMVRTARFFSAHEVSRYGPPSSGGDGDGDGGETDHRGTVLSCDLSLYLARCAVSEDVSQMKEMVSSGCVVVFSLLFWLSFAGASQELRGAAGFAVAPVAGRRHGRHPGPRPVRRWRQH